MPKLPSRARTTSGGGHPGRAPPAARAGEGLRDRQPLLRGAAGDDERRVVAVPSLRHQQGQVESRTADPIGRLFRTPGPEVTARPGDLDADGAAWVLETVGEER